MIISTVARHIQAPILVSILLSVTPAGTQRLPAAQPQNGPVILKPLATVQTIGGPQTPSFALVEDAVIDSRQRVYILDSRLQSITVIGRRGALLQRLGGPGQKDGGLFVPRALAVDDNMNLYVLDRAAQSLVVFRRARSDTLLFDKRLAIGFEGSDVCTSGNRIYVLGLHDGRLVHEVDPRTGATTSSFGVAHGGDDQSLAEALSRGFLACKDLAKGGTVVLAPHMLPEVRSFTLRGSIQWTHVPANFRSIVIERRQDTLFFDMPSNGYYNSGASVLALSDDWLLLQIGTKTTATSGRGQFSSIRSTVLRSSDGKVLFHLDSLPRLTSVRNGLAVSIENGPHPRVTLFSLVLGGPR